jgi:hypothetical protein
MNPALHVEAPMVGIVPTNERELRRLGGWRGRTDRGIGHGAPCPYCGAS